MTPPPDARAAASSPFDPAELPSHVAWVRRLAHALVRDAAAADDVAQETWRVTLAQPPGRVGGGARLRAWLGGVARRLALDRARSEASRAQRERTSGRDESLRAASGPHAPHEIVERSARQQRIVAAVMSLAEPYRSTVLYRYLDERSTRDVAERMAVSEEVVRKRLERGLAQLREQLDREFGAPTRQWAGLLLAGSGAIAMGAKAKAAVAAAVVIAAAGGAVVWNELAARGRAAGPEFSTVPAAVAAPESEERTADAPIADRVDERATQATPPPDTFVADEATVLRVTVVAPDGSVQRTGRLTGWWSESRHGGSPPPPRSFEQEIAGERTELLFPTTCAAVQLAASVAGFPAPSSRWVTDLRAEKEPSARRGRVERDVTLALDAPLPSAQLSGRIVVDGVPRVPRGFDLDVLEPSAIGDERLAFDVRIHAVDARYEVRPLAPSVTKLWVTSDETTPRQIEIAADDDPRTLDLDLSTTRRLRLTVVDRRSGAPLPGVELHVDLALPVERTLFQVSFRNHAHFVTTGADGVALVTGLPEKGTLDVRRDATTEERELPMRGGGSFRVQQAKEPLLSVELDASSPAVIERTLRIDVERPLRRLFGRLRADWLAPRFEGEPRVDVWWARVEPEGRGSRRTYREDSPIARDEEGAWSLGVQPDRAYLVWAERERHRLSEVARVEVKDDDVGPIELVPRRGSEVALRFVRCPSSGFVSLSIADPGAVTPLGVAIPVYGGTLERRVILDGPSRVSVSYEPDVSSESSQTTARDVDPATTPVVEFDLGADEARPIELSLAASDLPAESRLMLALFDAAGQLVPGVTAQAELDHGASRHPVALAPGRWLWFVRGEFRGVVAGVVVVERERPDVPIAIECDVEERTAIEVGRGFTVEALGGVEIPAELRKLLQWTALGKEASDAPVLVPRDARIAWREE